MTEAQAPAAELAAKSSKPFPGDSAAYRYRSIYQSSLRGLGVCLIASTADASYVSRQIDYAAAKARARAITWMFAALNTVEPPIRDREEFMVFERDKPWYEQRLPLLDDAVRRRLGELSSRLAESDWLDGDFSAGDLMMIMVVRRLENGAGLLEEFAKVKSYVARGEARSAYKRAFEAQMARFKAAPER
jgi:glutathione S-transferase